MIALTPRRETGFLCAGPWKFAVGDSPIDAKTGKHQWAEPDFDDSKWEKVDLAWIALSNVRFVGKTEVSRAHLCFRVARYSGAIG